MHIYTYTTYTHAYIYYTVLLSIQAHPYPLSPPSWNKNLWMRKSLKSVLLSMDSLATGSISMDAKPRATEGQLYIHSLRKQSSAITREIPTPPGRGCQRNFVIAVGQQLLRVLCSSPFQMRVTMVILSLLWNCILVW